MLSCSDVAVTLGSRTLFSGVTLRFPPGTCTALVGGNGAGKTTLLRTLIGQLQPDQGSVTRPKDLARTAFWSVLGLQARAGGGGR